MGGQLFMMMAASRCRTPYQAPPALVDMLGGRADVMLEAMLTRSAASAKQGARLASARRARRSFRHLTGASSCPATRRTSGSAVRRARRRGHRRAAREINAAPNDPALRAKVTQFGGTPLVGLSAASAQLFIRDSEKWAGRCRRWRADAVAHVPAKARPALDAG
jgi:hypothetical protein